jgi:hypothetical protein
MGNFSTLTRNFSTTANDTIPQSASIVRTARGASLKKHSHVCDRRKGPKLDSENVTTFSWDTFIVGGERNFDVDNHGIQRICFCHLIFSLSPFSQDHVNLLHSVARRP